MTAEAHTPEQKLAATLATLEAALLTPVIAGELASWVRAAREAAATLSIDLTNYLHTVLHVQYDEIREADAEMAVHVEKLLAGDQHLLEQSTRFLEDLHALAVAAESVKKNEGALSEQRQRVEDKGNALILAIKKQQAAATAWLSEAHFRDRGEGD